MKLDPLLQADGKFLRKWRLQLSSFAAQGFRGYPASIPSISRGGWMAVDSVAGWAWNTHLENRDLPEL